MTKVAIKNENITSFGGFYHLWTFFRSWALKNLVNQYWANEEVAARHSVMEIFFVLFSFIAENMVFIPIQESRTLEIPHING